jgi:hypothetical protein
VLQVKQCPGVIRAGETDLVHAKSMPWRCCTCRAAGRAGLAEALRRSRGCVRLADAGQAGCGFQGAFPGRRADGRQPRANRWKAALNAFDIT